MRTNCDNCGGVLIDGKCPYCGSVWFSPGLHVGKNAYIAEASVITHSFNKDAGRDINGCMYLSSPRTEFEVGLKIIGLTQEEVQTLFASIRGGIAELVINANQ